MRTETRTVKQLEFIPLPDEATAPCLAPIPDEDMTYAEVPEYAVRVLGQLEYCNKKLEEIRKAQPTEE